LTIDHVGETFAGRQALPLELGATVAVEARALGLADLIERLAEVAHDVEPAKQDRGLLRIAYPLD